MLYHHYRGLTLIECIIVLVIALILITMALPSMRTLSRKIRVTQSARMVHHFLTLASASALNAGERVIICPTHDEQHCVDDWQQRWMMFCDFNRNHQREASEKIIRLFTPRRGIKVNFRGFKHRIEFNSLGQLASYNASIEISLDTFTRNVIINRRGRVRLK